MARVSKGVTQNMKNFCHAYLLCGDATKAYLETYGTNSRQVASVESCKLLQRDDVTEYLTKINQPMVNKVTNEREKKRQIIWERIELCREKDNDAAIARYMDILNKMDAEYININRNIDDDGENISKLSTEQLLQLLDK